MSKFKVGDRVRVTKPSYKIYGEGTVVPGGVRLDEYKHYMSDDDTHTIRDHWGLELVAPATDYNDGKWHGWNGGECPVHPESVVECYVDDTKWTGGRVYKETKNANQFVWVDSYAPIVAFRVVTPYVEPKQPREFWLCDDHAYESRDKVNAYPGDEIIHVREVTE